MSDASTIEWTDATWNPVTGCTKVSAGCDHCYAETFYERFNGPGSFATVTCHPDRLTIPLRWRKPRRIFVNSMSDLFHADVPDDFIARVFAVMAASPRHTFQVLTKRHARMRTLLGSDDFKLAVAEHAAFGADVPRTTDLGSPGWPLRNVWLGVSVEDQRWADIRVPDLLGTPAAVRWISAEPLLGPVDLRFLPFPRWSGVTRSDGMVLDAVGKRYGVPGRWMQRGAVGLDWVVVGGESGPGARPMEPDWVRALREQCAEADVPFLFKQWGAHDECGYRVGKKAAGRQLDGETHDGYPQARTLEATA